MTPGPETHTINKKDIMEIKRLHVGKRLSEVAIHNETIYLAGQIA